MYLVKVKCEVSFPLLSVLCCFLFHRSDSAIVSRSPVQTSTKKEKKPFSFFIYLIECFA